MRHSQQQHFDHYGTTLALSAVIAGTVATVEAVAAPGVGKKIRVLAWVLGGGATSVVTFKSGTTAKTGPMVGSASGTAPFCPVGWFDCAENEALNVTVGTAVAPGVVVYTIVEIGA